MKNILKYTFFFVVVLATASCDDYLDIQPIGKVIPQTLTDYRGILTKGYDQYPTHKSLASARGDEFLINENSDELVLFRDIYIWKDGNPDIITKYFQYDRIYTTIFYTNVIINDANGKLETSSDKDQLIGEAYALRAYAYFDLLNLFAKPYDAATAVTDKGVPLALEVDLEQAFAPESVARIYEQIYADKEQAKKLLNKDSQEKGLNYRFSKASIYALESRISLYQKQWAKALEAADKALTFKNTLVDLNATPVLANNYDSAESILALENVFTIELRGVFYASPSLINVYDKTNDLRFPLYFQASGSNYRVRKGASSAQKCSFRASELYLTKAEAAAQLNDLPTAKTTVLTFIKNRYKVAGYNALATAVDAMDQAQLLEFIAQERQREFAAEGHRWFDLRRTTQKEIIHNFNGAEYKLIENDPRYTIPFPKNARLNNPSL